ncbi:Rho N domain containing protein, partial [Asbolus verrucosus]
LNIKKLKTIAEKLGLKIERNSKKVDLVNLISNNVNNENLNTLLKEIGSQRLEELLEESMSKTESTQNKSIKELRKIAKEKNIKGYSKMKKAELLQKIWSKSPHEQSEIDEEETSEFDLSDIIMKKIVVIRERLNDMIKTVKEKTNYKDGDLLNIVVNHNDLWTPISTGLSRTSDIDNLLNKIQSILTSNEDLDIYGCTFHAEVVNMPRGATNAKRLLNIAEDSRTKKNDIANIEKVLNIQIKVVAAECFNSIIYSGPEKDTLQKEYIVKNAIDTVLIKNVYKIILKRDKMVDEGNKMIEEGNKIIEKGNNKINMFTGKCCPEMGMIQKGNQMI